MAGSPDPKPTATSRTPIRQIDPDAGKRVLLRYRACAACGRQAGNAHHVVQKGAPHFGDDVEENQLSICGTGSARCHGAFHGNPYTDESGKRWTQEDVARSLGYTIATSRPDIVAYVLDKIGDVAGREYLRRVYYLEVA